MKTSIYALTAAAVLSATPAFAGSASDTAVDTETSAQSVSPPDDERQAPLAAHLQDAQRGTGPAFGNDSGETPAAQQNGMTIAPYPSSERPPFDRGR